MAPFTRFVVGADDDCLRAATNAANISQDFRCPWPPLIKLDENVRTKLDALFNV